MRFAIVRVTDGAVYGGYFYDDESEVGQDSPQWIWDNQVGECLSVCLYEKRSAAEKIQDELFRISGITTEIREIPL